MGRWEKVKFYIILSFLPCLVISPPEKSRLNQDGGNNMDLHLHTPHCARIRMIPHMEMERDRQQESACGCIIIGVVFIIIGVVFIITGVGFILIEGFSFIFEIPNMNCRGPPKLFASRAQALPEEPRGHQPTGRTAEDKQDT